MIKKFRNVIASIAAVGAMLVPVVAPATIYAAANIQASLCGATNSLSTTPQACAANGNENNGLNNIITVVINVFTVIVGFIAIVMMIYGGFKYITSSGDSGKVTSAKNTIMYALIGLILVALAQLIVRFVLGKANNVSTGVA